MTMTFFYSAKRPTILRMIEQGWKLVAERRLSAPGLVGYLLRMDGRRGTIRYVRGNWRRCQETDKQGRSYTVVELKRTDGTWAMPDCGTACAECGTCLGCVRRLVEATDSPSELECRPGVPHRWEPEDEEL